MNPTYPRAVAKAALQGLFTGAWVAARELSPARRRLARAGSMLVFAAVASIGKEETATEPDPEPAAEPEPEPEPEAGTRLLVVAAVSVAVAGGMAVGQRQLEKRWLAALARDGHAHPHRALALRMGLLSFGTSLLGPLVKVYAPRRPG